MDESLVLCALDVSGRAYLNYDVSIAAEKIGDFDTELIEEFFYAFVRNSGVTLHIKRLDGRNAHHIAEAAFKAFARALRQAVEIDMQSKDEIPSTKGVL
jgi:imidazoleglycerol-phosphate dehydratase